MENKEEYIKHFHPLHDLIIAIVIKHVNEAVWINNPFMKKRIITVDNYNDSSRKMENVYTRMMIVMLHYSMCGYSISKASSLQGKKSSGTGTNTKNKFYALYENDKRFKDLFDGIVNEINEIIKKRIQICSGK